MIAGYSGSAPLVTRVPFFVLLGLFGAPCGFLLGLAGEALGRRLAGR